MSITISLKSVIKQTFLTGSGSSYVDIGSWICILHVCPENCLQPFLGSTIKLKYKWLDGEIAYCFLFLIIKKDFLSCLSRLENLPFFNIGDSFYLNLISPFKMFHEFWTFRTGYLLLFSAKIEILYYQPMDVVTTRVKQCCFNENKYWERSKAAICIINKCMFSKNYMEQGRMQPWFVLGHSGLVTATAALKFSRCF